MGSDKYLLKASSSEGYSIQLIFLLLSCPFAGSFRMRIRKNGLSFYENNELLMVDVRIKGWDTYFADPSQLDRELVVESARKNHQISNNKKKDNGTLLITKDRPNVLVLRIKDSTSVTCMDIPYAIKKVEDDAQRYVMPDLKYVNPTVIIESGEMTKSIKIITKASAENVRIQAQKKAIRMSSIDETNANEAIVDVGKWDDGKKVDASHVVNKDSMKSILKFFNLSKRIRIHVNEDSFSMSLNIPSGLGRSCITFCDVATEE